MHPNYNSFFAAEKTGYTKAIEIFGQKQHRTISRSVIAFYAIFGTVTISMTAISDIRNPRNLRPYFSLITPNTREVHTSISILGELLTLFSSCMIINTLSMVEVILLSFSLFLKHSLRALSNNKRYGNCEIKMNPGIEAEYAELRKSFNFNIKRYQDLELLMHELNEVVSFLLIVLKSFALLNIYIFVYCLVTIEDRSKLQVYIIVAVIHIIRSSVMLPITGAVFQECLDFKNSWKSCLEIMSESQIQQLGFVEPFGFNAYFYTIKPHTILTFFSVLTSHIIVVLQVFNT